MTWCVAAMVAFVSYGFPLQAQSSDEAQQALGAALRAGDVAGVTAALDDGADPNLGSSVTPLYIAARRGDLEIVEILLAADADPNAVDASGRSTLIAALTRKHHDVARMLIAAGADVNKPEKSPGRGPLMLVIDEAPSLLSMSILLDAGADMNQPDKRGETPLAAAAFMGRADAARLLLERGVEVNVTNLDGVPPIAWARQRGNDDIVEMLIAAGATE